MRLPKIDKRQFFYLYCTVKVRLIKSCSMLDGKT